MSRLVVACGLFSMLWTMHPACEKVSAQGVQCDGFCRYIGPATSIDQDNFQEGCVVRRTALPLLSTRLSAHMRRHTCSHTSTSKWLSLVGGAWGVLAAGSPANSATESTTTTTAPPTNPPARPQAPAPTTEPTPYTSETARSTRIQCWTSTSREARCPSGSSVATPPSTGGSTGRRSRTLRGSRPGGSTPSTPGSSEGTRSRRRPSRRARPRSRWSSGSRPAKGARSPAPRRTIRRRRSRARAATEASTPSSGCRAFRGTASIARTRGTSTTTTSPGASWNAATPSGVPTRRTDSGGRSRITPRGRSRATSIG